MSTRASPSTPLTLVGRDRELGVLREHLTAALTGHGGLVLIGGEAGIGKTSLADAACREATKQGAFVLTGRCFDLTETPPYGPWLYLFERYTLMPGSPPGGMPPLPPAFSEPGQVGEVADQAMLFRQVRDFIKAVTAQRPVVLLLDDMHWADPASLDLLRFLAQSIVALPLLILVTYRTDEMTPQHRLSILLPLLTREGKTEHLDPRPLDVSAVQTLVAGRYAMPAADTRRLVSYLHARAEGNALFLGELLRFLEEAGVLRHDGMRWMLGGLPQTIIPPLLRQVIDGRLARLDAESRQLLAVAAVIGYEVPLAVWAKVAAVDEDIVLRIVELGGEAHLLAAMPDGLRAQFTHALMREAVYESTQPTRRRRLHQAVAETLLRQPNPDPDAVAYHLQQAGDVRAAEWIVRAGERAGRAYAWLTAAERYEAANGLMEASGAATPERGWVLCRLGILRRYAQNALGISYLDAAARVAAEVGDQLLAATILYYQGLMHCFTNRFDAGLAELRASVAALTALPPAELARRPPNDPIAIGVPTAQTAQGTLVLWLSTVGCYDESVALGERLVVDAPSRTVADRQAGKTYADAYFGLMRAYAGLGRPDAARHAFEQARDWYRAIEHITLVGLTGVNYLLRIGLTYEADAIERQAGVASESERAFARAGGALDALPPRVAFLPILVREGEWGEAQSLALTWRAAGSLYAAMAASLIGPLARDQGDNDAAWGVVRDALPGGPATEPGNTWFRETLVLHRLAAALATDARDLPTARIWLEAHDRWLAWNGSLQGRAEGQIGWAEYFRALGDAARARQHAEQALAHATQPRQPLAIEAAHRLLGEVLTDAGRHREAREHLHASLVLADACAAPYERALTLIALAEVATVTDDDTEAAALLDDARSTCIALNAQPALARADAIATRVAARRDTSPVYPAHLSTREVEVLRLLATGRTNREIADMLFLSVNTVRIHVAHILQKTNADNRAAAAVFAQRHGLV